LLLPLVSVSRAVTEGGGLLSYASSVEEGFRIVADCIDRILKGAWPGEIPMQQPTRFELIVNMKTANALGVQLPAPFLARIDEVFE
jgi:putative ABC transport system substrate-binding protein